MNTGQQLAADGVESFLVTGIPFELGLAATGELGECLCEVGEMVEILARHLK